MPFGTSSEALDRADMFHVLIPEEVQLAPPRAFNVVDTVPEDSSVSTCHRMLITSLTTPAVSGAAMSLTASVGIAPRRGLPSSGTSTSGGSPHPWIVPPGLSASRASSREYGSSCSPTAAPMFHTSLEAESSPSADQEEDERKYCCHSNSSISNIISSTTTGEAIDVAWLPDDVLLQSDAASL